MARLTASQPDLCLFHPKNLATSTSERCWHPEAEARGRLELTGAYRRQAREW